MKAALIWIGNKKRMEGIVGIPARDLTSDEVKKHGGEKALLVTGLYELPEKPKAKTNKAKEY